MASFDYFAAKFYATSILNEPRPHNTSTMRLVSWNIRAGGGKRAAGIVKQIQDWQPDIIALSEFRGTAASCWIAAELQSCGFRYQRTTVDPANPAANSLLLASRWPLRTSTIKNAPDNPRRWLHTNIASPNPITVIAIHIPNRSTGLKYPFLDAVINTVKNWRGPPAIILGDTNSGCIDIDEESPAFNKVEDQWIKTMNLLHWKDAFRHLNNNKRAYTWYSPNGRNGFRLDQAFMHPALHGKLKRFEYIWGGDTSERRETLSDHAAIVMDLNH